MLQTSRLEEGGEEGDSGAGGEILEPCGKKHGDTVYTPVTRGGADIHSAACD